MRQSRPSTALDAREDRIVLGMLQDVKLFSSFFMGQGIHIVSCGTIEGTRGGKRIKRDWEPTGWGKERPIAIGHGEFLARAEGAHDP